MSVQVFLQGRVSGIEQFLLATPRTGALGEMDGRSHYVSLLTEVLPRALLAELGLSKILLGSSGGEQFMLVLPGEARTAAEAFLTGAAAQVQELSGGALSLLWALTENLGDWSDVRKRLAEEMNRKLGTPAAASEQNLFDPHPAPEQVESHGYFSAEMGRKLREAGSAGWSPEAPGLVQVDGGKHQWSLSSAEGIPYARRAALNDEGSELASTEVLASRAAGSPGWGVLRGDVDGLGIRIRRAQSIEEHVQLSVMYKQFFAGELEVLCSLPEFWRKITVLYSGGDDFAVYGSWDALIALAREIQRVFQRFADENLKDYPGPEGKTISMALALAEAPDSPLASVFGQAGRNLELAKSSGKDCFYILGRTLEWKQVSGAEDAKNTMTRMVNEFGCSPQLLFELAGFYREPAEAPNPGPQARARARRLDRPWRFHRGLNLLTGTSKFAGTRNKEFQKVRSDLVSEFTGKNVSRVRLRPHGMVALAWARLEIGA
ncbi:MAG: Cas10/Cmr2 second palm domain-containing protein [Bryobacteraceae bacterium]